MDALTFMTMVDHEMQEFVRGSEKAKCHTFSSLIASYLYVHFDKEVKHVRWIDHGWVVTNDFVVDYVSPFEHVQTIGDRHSEFYAYCKLDEKETNAEYYDLLALDLAKNVVDPHSPKSFMEYIKSFYFIVDERVVKSGYYK